MSFLLFIYMRSDPPPNLRFHLFTVRRLHDECQKVLFEEYLQFRIFKHFDRCSTRLISNQGNLSEKSSFSDGCEHLSVTHHSNRSRINVVCTTIRGFSLLYDYFPCLSVLHLAHEEKIRNDFLGKTVKYVEIFNSV